MAAQVPSSEQTWLRKRPRLGLGTPVGPPDPRNRASKERSRDRRGGLIIGCDFRTRYQQIAMASGERRGASSDVWVAAHTKIFLGGWSGPPAAPRPGFQKPEPGAPGVEASEDSITHRVSL
jgi:hypothetical protein